MKTIEELAVEYELFAETVDYAYRLSQLEDVCKAYMQDRLESLEPVAYDMIKDAERYRWLKEQNADLEHDTFVVLAHDDTADAQWQKYWGWADLDSAIDEAMKAQ